MSNYRFKRSFIDSKNGDIRLYYLDKEGNSKVLITNVSSIDDTWAGIPKDLQKDARNRVKTLKQR